MHSSSRRPLVCTVVSTTVQTTPTPNASDTQLASTAAGLISRALLHPVDCLKTRLQHLRGRRDPVAVRVALSNFLAAEGLPGLYRGISGALAGVIPHSMLYMPSYEASQFLLGRVLGSRDLAGARHLIAGAAAGLAGSVVKVPVDVVKKRVQAGLHSDVFSACRAITVDAISKANPRIPQFVTATRAFYVGWAGAMVYGVPYNAIQFLVLEKVRAIVRRTRATQGHALVPAENVVVGALTGMLTSVLTEPLDVVKTRLMTQRAATAAGAAGETLYRNWGHCVRVMVREEGVAALWKGTLPRLIWVGASSAIWYGTYQTARHAFARRRVRRVRENELR